MKNLKKKAIIWKRIKETPDEIVDDFNPTENWEPGEETHCASNQTKSCLHSYLNVPFDLIVGDRVKKDVNENKVRVIFHVAIVIDCTIPYRAHVLSGHLFVNESITHFHLKDRWGYDEDTEKQQQEGYQFGWRIRKNTQHSEKYCTQIQQKKSEKFGKNQKT